MDHYAKENESNLFCLLLSVGCGFSNLLGTDLQTVRISDFSSNVGIVVVRDLGNSEILFMLLLKLAELLSPIVDGLTVSGLLQLSQLYHVTILFHR